MKTRTELEHVVLGVVWKKGPATAHSVRVEFSNSRSNRWTGSAGSIYPLMQRLEQEGLLRSRIDHKEARDRVMYRVTAKGLKALRRWLTPPFAEGMVASSYDPLHTRMYFLGALEGGDRNDFFMEAEAEIQRLLPGLEEDRERYRALGWIYSEVSIEGTIAAYKAQLKWLEKTRRRVSNE